MNSKMDISPFSSLVRVLVGALAGGCGSVACLWHCPRYNHMGNLDCEHGDSLDHDDAGQVISGEENGLVLLNFIPKPAMVVYKAYTQSVRFCRFLCFILREA